MYSCFPSYVSVRLVSSCRLGSQHPTLWVSWCENLLLPSKWRHVGIQRIWSGQKLVARLEMGLSHILPGSTSLKRTEGLSLPISILFNHDDGPWWAYRKIPHNPIFLPCLSFTLSQVKTKLLEKKKMRVSDPKGAKRFHKIWSKGPADNEFKLQ